MEEVFNVEYAGHEIRYSFISRSTRYRFRDFIRPADGVEYDIRVTHELMEAGRSLLPEGTEDGYVEYRLLIERTALELLQWGCCMFHSVAMLYRGRAWLFAAPSGTGKTTQFLNWQRAFPGEIGMICGDMPVVEPRADGSVWVHPSPWCGKENLGDRSLKAPLGGIVILEQYNENSILPVEPSEAIMPFFHQFILRPETEEQILSLTALMERMLKAVPVWRMKNRGDDASTEMLRGQISEHADELNGGCHA